MDNSYCSARYSSSLPDMLEMMLGHRLRSSRAVPLAAALLWKVGPGWLAGAGAAGFLSSGVFYSNFPKVIASKIFHITVPRNLFSALV